MKTALRLVFFLLMLAFVLPQSDAQILGRLKRKLENKLEDKMEDEVDKALSKKVDEELNQDTTLRKDNNEGGYDRTGAALFEGMIGSKLDMSNVELPESYTFHGTLTYKITSNQEDPLEITYLIPNKEEKVLGFQTAANEEQYFVWDLGRDVIVMYTTDADGNRNILKLPNMVDDKVNESATYEQLSVESTGRTKEILGFSCSEYKMTTEDTESAVWIAEDFPFDATDFSALMSQQAQNPSIKVLPQRGGMALEMTTYSGKDKKDETHMVAVDFSETEKVIQNTEK